MACSAVKVQAAAGRSGFAPRKPVAAPAGVPAKQQPFHWAKPHTATFASSSGMVSSSEEWAPSAGAPFVRPDVGEGAVEQLATFLRTTVAPPEPERPQFRSALEQVSFETNNSLLEQQRAPARGAARGLLDRAARLLRK